MQFEPYPFEKLNTLLSGITPNQNYEPFVLTIGEPQFETPLFIQESLCQNAHLLRKYPKSAGEESLRDAQLDFVQRRFGVHLEPAQLIPTFGTREVLFNFPQFLLHDKKEPVMAYTNPFYQIYEGAAKASRAHVVHLNLCKENGFQPDIHEPRLRDADLVILNFPNNPTASVMSKVDLGKWVQLALEYDFVLMNDECYSEIYANEKPPSLLEASLHVGNRNFKNVLVINSISKRSSAPSLRSGFIAGDSDILKQYLKYRTFAGVAVPLPLQMAAIKAWSDEVHVEKTREIYKQNLLLASEILHVSKIEATFYVWLEVWNDLEFTKKLYEHKNIKVLPGSFLGRDGMGSAFVRVALVEDSVKTKIILERINTFQKEMIV
ncbi:MAG: succinyldiaminopimelate transaminase [Sulfurospirillum sp.]|nr:succinyldiaminopimelate transaminase [Sulfurospirillum sp.]